MLEPKVKHYRVVRGFCIQDRQVLLVHQHTSRGTHWSLPGGKLEGLEPATAGLTREFQEETGVTELAIGSIRYVVESVSELTRFTVMSFNVTVPPGTAPALTFDPGGEVTEAKFFHVDEAEMLLAGHRAPHTRDPLLAHLQGRGYTYYHYAVPTGSDDFSQSYLTTAT